MRTTITVGLLCACALLVGCVHSTSTKHHRTGDREEDLTLAQSNLNFARALYGKLSRNEGNVFFSPFSIHTSLALTSLGARGSTLVEMNRGLSLPSDPEATKESFQKLTGSLQTNENVTLKTANIIFTDTEFAPKAEFVQIAQQYFHADASTVDFKGDAESARQKINKWVEDQTAQKIKDLFPEGTITSQTLMVLANAVYFKASWATPFDVSRTVLEPFYVSDTLTRNVPMMQLENEFLFAYNSELRAQILEIPYVGHKKSLLIILPNKQVGLSEVEQRLSEMPLSELSSLLSLPYSTHIRIWLPKFKMDQALELNEILKQLGMTSMFSGEANLSGITDKEVYVSKVVHKAFIEINEEGAEAAAATGQAFFDRMGPITFKANRPFVFLLLDKSESNAVLFMGRYSKP